ncbi:hypothetical protein [Phenylobacterium sp.]|uniref:hypothetical protein n=1 Tax=Phenylobacterium sp. TaxID=1871053 RepID=UPI003565D317
MIVTKTHAGLAAAGFLAAALAAAPLAAAPPAPKTEGRAQALQHLIDCRKLTDNTARLACFDEAAAAMDQAEAKGDIVVVDREQARKVRRQAFGFTLPSLALFERGEKPEEIANMEGKITAARQNNAGKWVIRLEDGATWSQIDTNEVPNPPQAGDTVTIRKAAMGSYMMSLGHHVAFRAHRDN